MIEKISQLKNLAVFKDFGWDSSVADKDGTPLLLKKINIIYGRNYSGKTTLSRVLRSLETDHLSDKYINPEFKVSIKDEDDVTHLNKKGHNKKIRVFNEDFVRENLSFISNPDEDIKPFAILGGDNTRLEEEIKELYKELGSNEEKKETGYYKQLKVANSELKSASLNHSTAQNQLDNQKKIKATDRKTGIKYNSAKFGDQNYNISALNSDIKIVLADKYVPISNEKQSELEALLKEQTLPPIHELPRIQVGIVDFILTAKSLIEKKIGVSDKIDELVKNSVLHRWVKEGRVLHKDKKKTCAFCNNPIDEKRWEELDKHFDEESTTLENNIDSLISKIEHQISVLSGNNKTNKSNFYIHFHKTLDDLDVEYKTLSESYNSELESLIKQLKGRKDDIINPKVFEDIMDYSEELKGILDKYKTVGEESNTFTDSLSDEQKKAKNTLRLCEVHDFVTTIAYSDTLTGIEKLNAIVTAKKSVVDTLERKIKELSDTIQEKKDQQKDETLGAEKVNEYLNNFFGHEFLSLQPVEYQEEDRKKIRFEVIRNDQKAYHLSEGECSLISFCYFMAKLEDYETKDSKPIIWIDDPISSLDGNHIFFIYSLINSEIALKKQYSQLFVSTHDLNFLKYLKRLPGAAFRTDTAEHKRKVQYLIVQRIGEYSTINQMPDYLREYVTEFNYLFDQIYKCSELEVIDGSNYTTFYNFGNNARKFFEIYLYYRYPDSSSDSEKLEKFFGEGQIPQLLIDRINNEYSHMCGVFERGAIPVDVPEMKTSADLIIKKLKEDEDQFAALLKSIGKEVIEEGVSQ